MRTTPSFALAMLILNFVGVVRGFRGPIETVGEKVKSIAFWGS